MESGKVRKALYEEIFNASDSYKECDVCLTIGQVRWILSQTDYAGWDTRYYTLDNSTFDHDKILAMRDDLIERLFMTCCGDIQTIERRVNEETGVVEISTDGGLSWIPDPDDPRNSGVQLPPPVTSGQAEDKCAAANSVTKQLQVYVDDIINSKTNDYSLVDLALAIAAIVLAIWVAPAWALLPFLIMPLITKVFQASIAEVQAAMSLATYQQFTCIIYCNMQDDGTMTQAGWTQAINDMNQQFAPYNPLGYNTCRAFMLIYGLLGVNNAAAQGLNYGYDCTNCDCGGCDFSSWEIWAGNGTIVSQDANHVEVAATFGSGQWNAGVRVTNIYSCCCNVVISSDTGGQPTVIAYNPCGAPNDDQTYVGFAYSGQAANAFAVAGTAAFTITFTKGDPC